LCLGCGVAACAAACGSSGGGAAPSDVADATAGNPSAPSDPNGHVPSVGARDGAASGFTTDSSVPSKLSARILPVKCNGRCADVRVDVEGGNPPYSIQWDDGSTSTTREVCSVPDGGGIHVQVTDTAGADHEIPMPAQTATDQAGANELDCTPIEDAGAGCQFLLSSTFLGAVDAAPYASCDDAGQSVSLTLPQPLHAGQSYKVEMDLVFPVLLGSMPSLEFWGASQTCADGQRLGKLTFDGSTHLSFCAEPTQDFTSLTIYPEVPDGAIFILALALQETVTVCGGCSGN
jgi:hypothetical protein